ncbi:MAG: hypothetical protein AAF368_17140, partial [Planctomycetota bacterium]
SEAERQQEELRRKLLDLAERNQERENAPPSPAMDRAAEAAQRAQEALEQGDLSEAERQQEEAEREMRRAQEELQEEEEQYQRLRAEELLFKIQQEVVSLLDTHREQMAQTVEIDESRSGRLSRALKLRLRRVSREEESIAARCNEIAEALREENTIVFTELMENARDDLGRVTEALGDRGGYTTGGRVQALQQDVEQYFEWLLEALEEEQERREEEEQQEGGEQENGEQDDGGGENRLVPDSGELKLLRRFELDVLQGVEELRILNPELFEEGAEIDPLALEDVARLARRHERTSQLFARFRERLGLPDPNAPKDSEGEAPEPQDSEDK